MSLAFRRQQIMADVRDRIAETVDVNPPKTRVCNRELGTGKSPVAFAFLNVKLGQRMQNPLSQLKVKIFADGADKKGMLDLYANPLIQGMTTNPTLMRKVGITDYETLPKTCCKRVKDKPISFEVFSDEFPEMKRQALKINVVAKERVCENPDHEHAPGILAPLIRELGQEGVQLNITAMLTLNQVHGVAEALNPAVPSVVSVFAGRIADTGHDPAPSCGSQDHSQRTSPKPNCSGPACAKC